MTGVSEVAMRLPRVGCVDAVTAALVASGSSDVSARLVKLSHPWGFRLDTRSAALVAVTQGRCFVRQPATTPVGLVAGDLALVPTTRRGHGLASTSDGPLAADATTRPDGLTTSLVYVAYEPAAATEAALSRVRAGLPGLIVVEGMAHLHRGVLDGTLGLLAGELVHNDPGARTAIHGLLDVLVVHMVRAWMAAEHPDGSSWSAAAPGDEAVSAAVDLIHTYPRRGWTNQTLAAQVGLSRAAFVRRFTAMVGEAPSTYLTGWRLATAARRLRETAEPLAAIAHGVGYSSEFTFSRAFSRAYGQPPGRYRAEARRQAME
jgi:AraC-like DNA-binding protein